MTDDSASHSMPRLPVASRQASGCTCAISRWRTWRVTQSRSTSSVSVPMDRLLSQDKERAQPVSRGRGPPALASDPGTKGCGRGRRPHRAFHECRRPTATWPCHSSSPSRTCPCSVTRNYHPPLRARGRATHRAGRPPSHRGDRALRGDPERAPSPAAYVRSTRRCDPPTPLRRTSISIRKAGPPRSRRRDGRWASATTRTSCR